MQATVSQHSWKIPGQKKYSSQTKLSTSFTVDFSFITWFFPTKRVTSKFDTIFFGIKK